MKKLLLVMLSLFALGSVVWADWNVHKSTVVAGTADTNLPLCTGSQRGVVYDVCTSSPIAATGITLYNSTFTTTFGTGFVTTATYGCVEINTVFPKGLMYTKSGTAIAIVGYDCY